MQSNGLRAPFAATIRRLGIPLTRYLVTVSVGHQTLTVWERTRSNGPAWWLQRLAHGRASTSRFGVGQSQGSNRTPLGLHRIAQKVGAGYPQGTVFSGRKPVGLTWRGMPEGAIAHRIFWLEGLEPGFNRGGDVDTFRRYIYIHGFSDESTLRRPVSKGCIHLAAADIIPLYDWLPVGTLVWIHAG
jgi:hypothetical protein